MVESIVRQTLTQNTETFNIYVFRKDAKYVFLK